MIQVYKPGTSLENNGDIVLTPTECTVTARLNEVWVLEMTHPIDPDGRWTYIVEEGILKVPTWQTNEQLYRISQIEKTNTEVRVVAYPIFTDTRNQCFIGDLTVSGTGQTVLNQMLALGPDNNSGGKLYTASSNLPTARRAQFARRNFMDCLNGTDDPTFVKLWGGEIVYDNFKIYVNQEIGGDHDVYVRYGKNITGVEYTVDFSEVCTRIYPEAYGGYGIQTGQAWVDSNLINTYDCLYVRNVVFDNIRLLEDVPSTEESVNYIVCANRSQMDAYLRQACSDMFSDGCDKPKVSMKVDLIDLSITDQYKDFVDLEKISLGDTVHCVHNKLGITSDSRAVCIVWDCTRDRIQSVELGEFTYDYFRDVSTKINAISQITNPDGSIMAERVRGFLDATKTAIHTIRTTATDAHVMGVLFEDRVEGSVTYGALGIGTKGLMIAREWDENTNDWAWETAITAEGILSPMIVTNTISGTSAQNWWDLQLGKISFQTISNDINQRISIATGAIDTDMTGLEICNAIYEDGAIKGFQTRTVDGREEFYLSFSALIGGQIELGGVNNGNGLLIVKNSRDVEIARLSNSGAEFKNSSGEKMLDVTDKIRFYSNGEYIGEQSSDRGFIQVSDPGRSSSKGFQLHRGTFCYYKATQNIIDDWIIDFSRTPDIQFDLKSGTFTDNINNGFSFETNSFIIREHNTSGALVYLLEVDNYRNYRIEHSLPLYQTSDLKFKKNIEKPLDTLSLIKSIPVVSYDWKIRKQHVSVGLVAQHIKDIVPELVGENDKGDMSIDYIGFVPYLIKAIQEQSAIIEEQKARIDRLENMVKTLIDNTKKED